MRVLREEPEDDPPAYSPPTNNVLTGATSDSFQPIQSKLTLLTPIGSQMLDPLFQIHCAMASSIASLNVVLTNPSDAKAQAEVIPESEKGPVPEVPQEASSGQGESRRIRVFSPPTYMGGSTRSTGDEDARRPRRPSHDERQ